jgi:predicted nucleotidyltransferase
LFFIEEIWLYGSRARGNQRERSDIDLAIVCPQANTQDWQKVLAILDEADPLLQIG